MSQDYHDRSGFSLVTEFLDSLLHGSDRDRAGLLLVAGVFLCSVGACFLLSNLDRGYSLSEALTGDFVSRESLVACWPVLLLCLGLLVLSGAAAFSLKWRIRPDADRREIPQEPLSWVLGCTVCGTSNPPDSEYCGECGAALERTEE